MSVSKHFNKLFVIALILMLVLTTVIIYFNNGKASDGKNLGYEEKIFDTSVVHTIDIQMDDWDGFIEKCENEEYEACNVVIDGEKFKNIGIRAKGNTSLSSVKAMGSERYSFKLEFDQYTDGNSYYGLDKLCLNNLIQDNTMMKDYITYEMMRDFGVDTPLCSFVYITVNGEDWGLYMALEGVEESFLQRNYGSDYGELYKPDSMSFANADGGDFPGGGKKPEGFDFNGEMPEGFDFNGEKPEDFDFNGEKPEDFDFNGADFNSGDFSKDSGGNFGGDFNKPEPADSNKDDGESSDTNQPSNQGKPSRPDRDGFEGDSSEKGNQFGGMKFGGMGSEDVKLQYINENPESYTNIFNNAKTDVSKADQERLISSLKKLGDCLDLENTVDTDEVLRYFVVHNFVCNGDSYTGSIVHNYYLYEEDGQLSMIPWDYNLAFGTFQGNDASGNVNADIDNPVSAESDDRPMLDWIFKNEEYTEKYHELFAEFVKEWGEDGKLNQLINDTANLIRPYVEKDPTKFCTPDEFEKGINALSTFCSLRIESITRQLEGDDSLVDTEGLNISDMGTMQK